MNKILVSDPIADKGIDLLEKAKFEVLYNPNPSNDELLVLVKDIDAWIIRSGTKIKYVYRSITRWFSVGGIKFSFSRI